MDVIKGKESLVRSPLTSGATLAAINLQVNGRRAATSFLRGVPGARAVAVYDKTYRLVSNSLHFYYQGFYRRTPDYYPTRNRQRVGCFPVPMLHATFLLDLRKEESSKLAFYPPHPNYTWTFDDIIVFAYSCLASGVYGKTSDPSDQSSWCLIICSGWR